MVDNCSAAYCKTGYMEKGELQEYYRVFWLAEFEAIFKGKLHTFHKTLTLNAHNAFKNSLHYFKEKYFKRG